MHQYELGKDHQENLLHELCDLYNVILAILFLLNLLWNHVEQLDKLGMEVIPVELRDAYAFGGGLHCCTADVYREGDLKDYFPKQ